MTPKPDSVTLGQHVEQLVEVRGTSNCSVVEGCRAEVGKELSLQDKTWVPCPHPTLCMSLKSVFKNYDPEGHGSISLEDFERLSGNFPFACHGLHPPPRHG